MKNLFNSKRKLTVIIILLSGISYAQVGIGTSNPDNSAILHLSSSNKG